MIAILIVLILVILIVIIVGMYNGLIQARNKVKNAWGQIEVQLQRRFDLIPNLVESVKGYMKHEEKTLTKVTELRTSWANATTISEKADLNNTLSGALKTILAVSENYPELKANNNFIQLQSELKETENKIAYSRQFYNDTVTMYNNKLQVVPTNIIASMFKFEEEELFKTTSEEAKQNVKVDFNS